MKNQQLVGWALVALVATSYMGPVLCYPGLTPIPEVRKFAEKPNALKKVAIDNDLDDVSTNQISVSTLLLVTSNPINPKPVIRTDKCKVKMPSIYIYIYIKHAVA
jgi:hypothetical protein